MIRQKDIPLWFGPFWHSAWSRWSSWCRVCSCCLPGSQRPWTFLCRPAVPC